MRAERRSSLVPGLGVAAAAIAGLAALFVATAGLVGFRSWPQLTPDRGADRDEPLVLRASSSLPAAPARRRHVQATVAPAAGVPAAPQPAHRSPRPRSEPTDAATGGEPGRPAQPALVTPPPAVSPPPAEPAPPVEAPESPLRAVGDLVGDAAAAVGDVLTRLLGDRTSSP